MGSKISLLVYEWPLIKCRIWCMNGLIFQNFPKIESELAKFKKILEKSGNFAQNLANCYMKRLLFLEKLVFVWSTVKFCGRTSLPKPNFPPPPQIDLLSFFHSFKIYSNIIVQIYNRNIASKDQRTILTTKWYCGDNQKAKEAWRDNSQSNKNNKYPGGGSYSSMIWVGMCCWDLKRRPMFIPNFVKKWDPFLYHGRATNCK